MNTKPKIAGAALCLALSFSPLLHAGYVESVTSVASDVSGTVTLQWSSVPQATNYSVYQWDKPAGSGTRRGLVSATTNTWTDYEPNPFTRYYTVLPVGATGVSALTECAARPCVIQDDASVPAADRSDGWLTSSLAGSFNGQYVYASNTGTAPRTFTFRPPVTWTGNHDVYMRWPVNPSGATNVTVRVKHALGQVFKTIVNQQADGGKWKLLVTLPFDIGNAEIILSTESTNGIVGADAVQLVPRPDPMAGYTMSTFEDNFSGATYDTEQWKIFETRSNVTVADGALVLTLKLKSGQSPELGASWTSGGLVTTKFLQKYGYYEVRYRPTQKPGVDNAFWLNRVYGKVPDMYEIDTPEIFTRVERYETVNGVKTIKPAVTSYSVGVADRRPTSDPKRPTDREVYAFLDQFYINSTKDKLDFTQHHVWGLEWRTDNTLVCYRNGEWFAESKTFYNTATSQFEEFNGVDYADGMLPQAPLLSTAALDFLIPKAELDGDSMKVDYIRVYQKPGWLGKIDDTWSNVANWGADGVPGSDFAAVFNRPAAQTAIRTIRLTADTEVKSLYFDNQDLPALTIGAALSPYRLKLGKSPLPQEHGMGGVTLNTEVQTTQTVAADILAQRALQFANMSRTTGVELLIKGAVNGDPAIITPDLQVVGSGAVRFEKPIGSNIGEVVKFGPGEYTAPSDSSYKGPTKLIHGKTIVTQLGLAGQNSSIGKGGLEFASSDSSYHPVLTYTGAGAVFDRGFKLSNVAEATIESSGSGALTLSGVVELAPSVEGTSKLILGGSYTGANTLAVGITPAGAKLNVVKRGEGSWALGAGNWVQTGSLTIEAGSYDLKGNNSTQGAVLVSGGTLKNSSTTAVELKATSFNLRSPGTLQLRSSDRVIVSGAVTLAGTLAFFPRSDLIVGTVVTLVENTGTAAISGTFAGLPEGATYTAANLQKWKITYRGGTGGNDVVLTRLP